MNLRTCQSIRHSSSIINCVGRQCFVIHDDHYRGEALVPDPLPNCLDALLSVFADRRSFDETNGGLLLDAEDGGGSNALVSSEHLLDFRCVRASTNSVTRLKEFVPELSIGEFVQP